MVATVNQVDQLLASIRAAWARREAVPANIRSKQAIKSNRKNKQGSAQSPLYSLQDSLLKIDRQNPKAAEEALRAYVEAVLLAEFGNKQIALDQGFADLLDRVVSAITSDKVFAKKLGLGQQKCKT